MFTDHVPSFAKPTKLWQIIVAAIIIPLAVAGVCWGAVAGVKALNRAAASASENNGHTYGITSQERAALDAQAATNPTVKILLDKKYSAVNITLLHNQYMVVFKPCGNASLTDCAERSHPTGNAMWVRVAMDTPSDIKNPATFHLQTKADFLYERKGYSHRMLYCMPQTAGWTLNADTYPIGGQIWPAFKDLTYDHSNGYSQRKVVGQDEVYCFSGKAL